VAGRILSLKKSNEAIGIEHQIFRLVEQCLIQLGHRVSRVKAKAENISVTEVLSSHGAQNLDYVLFSHDTVQSGQ